MNDINFGPRRLTLAKRAIIVFSFASAVTLITTFITTRVTDLAAFIKSAKPITAAQFAAEADNGRPVLFTLNRPTSNFSERHPESPHLLECYVLITGYGRRTHYKHVLDPEPIKITDRSGSTLILKDIVPRFAAKISEGAKSQLDRSSTPDAVMNVAFDNYTLRAIDKDKPVTVIATVARGVDGYELLSPAPGNLDGPIVFNGPVEDALKRNSGDIQQGNWKWVLLFGSSFVITGLILAVTITLAGRKQSSERANTKSPQRW